MLRVRTSLGLSFCLWVLALGGCSGGGGAVDTNMQQSTGNTPTPDTPNVSPAPNTPNVTPPASNPPASNPPASNPPAVTPPGNPPPNSPPATPGAGLSGEWDVIYSSPSGRTDTLQVTLSPTLLELIADDDEALVITNGSTFDIAIGDDKVDGTRTANPPIQLGLMPLPLDGTIHFADGESPEKACDSVLTASEFSFTCGGDVGGGFNGSKTTAIKTKSLVSDFGDVGGEWAVTSGNVTCTATLEGATAVVACQGGSTNGDLTITFDGDRVTGITSGGAEFTAQRR